MGTLLDEAITRQVPTSKVTPLVDPARSCATIKTPNRRLSHESIDTGQVGAITAYAHGWQRKVPACTRQSILHRHVTIFTAL